VSVYAATLIDKVGRRPLFLGATTGMVVSFVCWTITCAIYENSGDTNSAAGYAQIPFVWIFGVFYAFAWSGLLVAYALEILPYALRAKGLMIMNITVQAILAVGGQTNPVAWDNLPKHWNLALFYTLWITVELVFVYFVYPETKVRTCLVYLENIANSYNRDLHLRRLPVSSTALPLWLLWTWTPSPDKLLRSASTTSVMRRSPMSSRATLFRVLDFTH